VERKPWATDEVGGRGPSRAENPAQTGQSAAWTRFAASGSAGNVACSVLGMTDRILVPLDGSVRAEQILVQVARLLRREDAEVVLLSVAETPPTTDPDAHGDPVESVGQAMAAYLAATSSALAEQGVRVRSLARTGSPAGEIVRAAEEENATLIAISTHGRSGVSRWLLGSVAEKVVRAAPVPVLLMRSFHHGPRGIPLPAGRGEIPFRRLLLPVDGSEASLQAVPAAAAFGRLFASEIDVLCVEDPPRPLLGVKLPPVSRRAPGPGAATEAAVERALDRLRSHDVPGSLHGVSAVGDPGELILSTAEARRSDLIVMASHGRSGVARWALGSVTERVLRHGTLPLLIVRARP
jgi:nucleotide-binding universal stress UspA family protein